MANNLHISYDLNDPGKNYDAVIKAIKELGNWVKVHKSFWYVNSQYSAGQAVNHIWKKMDRNDTVYVVDATNNSAAWENLSDDVKSSIRNYWKR